jgi:hypothetical protein
MFLDVATILRGHLLDRAMAVWKAWHGPAAPTRFADLQRRCLLGVDDEGRLAVHDVLVALGRGIILNRTVGFKEHYGSRVWVEDRRVVGFEQVGFGGLTCVKSVILKSSHSSATW